MTWPWMAHQTPAMTGSAEQLLAGDARFRAARNPVYVVFLGNGFQFAKLHAVAALVKVRWHSWGSAYSSR